MIRTKFWQLLLISIMLTACRNVETSRSEQPESTSKVLTESDTESVTVRSRTLEAHKKETTAESTTVDTTAETVKEPETTKSVEVPESDNKENNKNEGTTTEIGLNQDWEYASFSKINSGKSVLYKAGENGNGITVAVNAGHGTKGGSSQKTLCHPDGTPKVTGGTTKSGATKAIAVSEGMTFADGTPESAVTYDMAQVLKSELLSRGYNVLMIRNDKDVQLDNVARTVIANNNASIHIALHWDSTESDKGAFYMGVPEVSSYRGMEPVASNWEKHEALGKSLIAGLSANGAKIFNDGRMEMDLTQTSYSTIPSIDIELGDGVSEHGIEKLKSLSTGIADGIDNYFGR